jgi:acyl-coenzyme A synthetase/AMP-(fatty) acid ligase
LYNFAVRASYARAMLTLQFGGTIHLTGVDVLWDLIAAGIGNHMVFVTGDLERFVRAAPYGPGPFALYIDAIGGAVPRRLRYEIRQKLTEYFMVTYSSNETSGVSEVDDDNIGTLLPGVCVRIVDEQGESVPMGQPGLIQVRTDRMTQGYINAPELNRAAFVDGWFNTSDLGFQPSKGKLVVLGRGDGMLNIGGVKVAPGPIEEQLKAIDGIGDALVTGTDDQLATENMLVAIEMVPGARPDALAALITPIIRSNVTHFQLLFMWGFPRTETGKIQREAVKDIYRRQGQRL